MRPAWEELGVTLYQGHALEVLRGLPEESVHCIVTSPPYWGLRDYKVPAEVFGGRRECPHEWSEPQLDGRRGTRGSGDLRLTERRPDSNHGHASQGASSARSGRSSALEPREAYLTQRIGGRYCSRCGAWQGQLGLEPTPQEFVCHLVEILEECRRVLRRDGTLWLNVGDSWVANQKGPGGDDKSTLSASGVRHQREKSGMEERWQRPGFGLQTKQKVLMPYRLALALQDAGWWLRQECIWEKPNAMPESVKDRPATAHEYVFLLSKAERYFYDDVAVQEAVTGQAHPRGNGVHPKALEADEGVKQNGSFSAAVREVLGQPEDRSMPLLEALLEETGTFVDEQGFARTYQRRVPLEDSPRRTGILDRLATARANGAPHDQPFGATRNMRSVWSIPTVPFSGSHFAVFPPELPRRCISAGTSAHGVCATCGAPWRRVVARQGHAGAARGTQPSQSRDNLKPPQQSGVSASVVTLGWKPSCRHEGEPVPAVVLDPFAGSGTTLAVAKSLNRDAVGVELGSQNIRLIQRRVEAAARQLALPEVF